MATACNHIGQDNEGQREQHANDMAACVVDRDADDDRAPGEKEPGFRVVPRHPLNMRPLNVNFKMSVGGKEG
jgi:hypothetical protein